MAVEKSLKVNIFNFKVNIANLTCNNNQANYGACYSVLNAQVVMKTKIKHIILTII